MCRLYARFLVESQVRLSGCLCVVVHLLLLQEDFEKVVDHRVDSLHPDEVDNFVRDIVEGGELVSVVFWCNELVLEPL